MNEKFKSWLVSDHYMDAGFALLHAGVDTLESRYRNREVPAQSKEEFLLLYSLGKIAELGEAKSIETVQLAYWNLVKKITMGDVAWQDGNKYTDWHYARVIKAHDKLASFAIQPEAKAIFVAADKFNRGRTEYFGQFYSLIN